MTSENLEKQLAEAQATITALSADLEYQHKNRDQMWEQKKQAEAALAEVSRRLAQVTEQLQEVCDNAGSMGYQRDPSGEFSIIATAVIERARAALRAPIPPEDPA